MQNRVSRCDASDPIRAQTKPPKSLPVADLGGVVRPDATTGTSSGGGTRTPDTRIMISHAHPLNLQENDNVGEGAGHSTALETAKAPITAELARVIDAWDLLPPDTRTVILAIVAAARGR